MGSSPASVVNRALDMIGRPDLVVGELGEGTEAAKPALRAYAPAMRQMLRSGPALLIEMPNSFGSWLISTVSAMPFM